jgi:hypothetical protein
MAKIIRREWTSVCVRCPTPSVDGQETRIAVIGRFYTDSLE